jgi:SAM-dependent methyltransferase
MNSIKLIDRDQCPLCGGCKKFNFIAFPDIPVVQCDSCGFMYSSRVLSEEDIYSYYRNSYGGKRHLQGQIVNATINSWAVAKLIDMTGIASVLDVGAGYGFLLDVLAKQFKIDTAGVELSQKESEYAVKMMGVNVINAPLEKSGLMTNHYDLVAAFEVIEHILNPVEFIRELAQYVKPGGYLLLMTDNFSSRMAQSLGAGFPKWIPHVHISHFSPVTLKSAIEKVENLTVVNSMSYTPWEIMLRNAYYRFRGIKITPSEAFNLENEFVNEITKGYKFFALRRLVNKKWAQMMLNKNMGGDLMYFVAKRIR